MRLRSHTNNNTHARTSSALTQFVIKPLIMKQVAKVTATDALAHGILQQFTIHILTSFTMPIKVGVSVMCSVKRMCMNYNPAIYIQVFLTLCFKIKLLRFTCFTKIISEVVFHILHTRHKKWLNLNLICGGMRSRRTVVLTQDTLDSPQWLTSRSHVF